FLVLGPFLVLDLRPKPTAGNFALRIFIALFALVLAASGTAATAPNCVAYSRSACYAPARHNRSAKFFPPASLSHQLLLNGLIDGFHAWLEPKTAGQRPIGMEMPGVIQRL